MSILDPSGSMSLTETKVSAQDLVEGFAERGQTDVESVILALGLGNTGVDTVVFITDGEQSKGSNPFTESYS